jgi:hypothetical protein
MYVLAINHPVADYDKWKALYDTMPPTSRGAKFARVNRGVDDPDLVTVVAGFDSLEALNGFASDPELKSAMLEAGVTGEPRFETYQEVEVI